MGTWYSGRYVSVGDVLYFSKFGTTISSGYSSKSGTFGTCYGTVSTLYGASYAFPVVISGKVVAGTGGSFTGCTVKPSDCSKGYQVTVTYNKNGGSGTGSQTGYVGASLTGSASRTGYTFAGWYTSASGGSRVYSIPTNGTTYYAHWTGNTYYVQFNGNGNTGGSTAKETFTYGTAKALTANGFTKTGYTFYRWSRNADGSGTTYTNGQSVSNLATSGTVNVYAQWTPNNYTVIFNGNGALSGSMADQSFTYDTPQKLTANGFSKGVAYRFTGWNTLPDGTGTTYADEAEVSNLTETNGGNVVLYAQWELTYIAPAINNITSLRYENGAEADDGTQIYVSFDYAADLIVSSTNYITDILVEYKISSDTTWTQLFHQTYSSQTAASISGTFSQTSAADTASTDATYDIRISLTDLYGTSLSIPAPQTVATDFLSTAYFTMDFAIGGYGIGIGCPAPSQGLEVAMPTEFTDDVTGTNASLSGDLTVSGAANIGALDDGYGINDDALLSAATIAKWNDILEITTLNSMASPLSTNGLGDISDTMSIDDNEDELTE